MAIPRNADARRYYRAALERLEDARHIMKLRRSTAAVYLGGYAVECLLKALILSQSKELRHESLIPQLRTHSFDAMRRIYAEECGGSFPKEINRTLSYLSKWAPHLRYEPATIPQMKLRNFYRQFA